MVKAPEKEPGPGKPKIFLGLATLMVVIAGLAYAFEDWLYTVRPLSPYSTNQLNTYFIGILVLSVILALFFVFCYQNHRFGNRLLGREVTPPREKKTTESTVTYNVFYNSTASSVKFRHRRRKLARHERHKFTGPVKKPRSKNKA